MQIVHNQFPFYHTIIYDVFDDNILKDIISETNNLDKDEFQSVDKHHQKVKHESLTRTIRLDNHYNGREHESAILQNIQPIHELLTNKTNVLQNPFLGYISTCNYFGTHIQIYKPGSKYFPHQDSSTLTTLFVIWLEKQQKGGELIFLGNTEEDTPYVAPVKHNSCIVFPGYQFHTLNDVGSRRMSINTMLSILPFDEIKADYNEETKTVNVYFE